MGAVSVDQRAPIGPLPVGAKLGRYEILAKLAAGGMAIVYVARAQGVAGFERLVAIKVLHSNLAHEEEFIKMFLDEARLAASIRHPNVVPTIDISDSEKSGYFIVMEYIEGDHLGQLLSSATKAGERLPIPVTLRIITDALGGLGAAHDLCDDHGRPQNLVHRDVSPHNIMVGRDGVARLTDFGVAKAEDRLTHTRDGQVKGKLAYMAPEQAATGTTDPRSDLFSMGVILWECLTGQRLLRAESTAATLHKLLHAEIPRPSTVDPALEALDPVLDKALARDPVQRFQTAEEFARALEDAAAQFGGLASLREVGRMCRHHAATKLKRDKKLIDEATRALRPSGGGIEGEGMLAADETSCPSSSEISIVAGGSPSLVSKVSNVVANETMPGTRRASRRTPEIALPQPLAAPPMPPPPLGAAPGRSPVWHAAGDRAEVEVEVGPAVPFEAVHDTLELHDPSVHARRRARLGLVLIGLASLVGLGFWFGDAPPEVVRAEPMDVLPMRPASTAAPASAPSTSAPPSLGERAGVAVTAEPPATQVIAPVVPPESRAAKPSSGSRSRDSARSPRTSPRRHREAVRAAPPPRAADVIPNPYHD